VPAPHACDAVGERERGVGIGSDVGDGEIVGDEGVGEAAEGDGHERALSLRRRPRRAHPCAVTSHGSGESQRRLGEPKAQRERESELADFRDHLRPAAPCTRVCAAFSLMDCACLIASAAAGGM